MIKDRCLKCSNCFGATFSFATGEVIGISCGEYGPVDGPTIATGCEQYSARPCCINCAHYRPQGPREGGRCVADHGDIFTIFTQDKTALIHLCQKYRPEPMYKIDPATGEIREVE